jgi:hypothetical protein
MVIDLMSLDWNETTVYLADNTTDWDLSLLLGINWSDWWKVFSVDWSISNYWNWISKNFSNNFWFCNFNWCWFISINDFFDWCFYWGFNWGIQKNWFWFGNFNWCWFVSNNFFNGNFIEFGCWLSIVISGFVFVPSISLNDV